MEAMDHFKRTILAIIFGLSSCAFGANIFVDNQLADDCTSGEYSIAHRDNSGSDGDAYNGLQEAVNAVSAGGTVWIRGGIYALSAPIQIVNKTGTSTSAKITLASYDSEQVTLNGSSIPYSEYAGVLSISNSDYIIISDMTITGYSSEGIRASNAAYLEVDNVVITGHGRNGIHAITSDYVKIAESVISGNGSAGVYLCGSSHGTVTRNEIHSNGLGITITGQGTPEVHAGHNVVSSNLVYNHTSIPEHSDGINSSSGAHHTTIAGNIVFACYDDGIDCSTSQAAQTALSNLYHTITNNIVFEIGDAGGDGDGNGIKVSTNCGGGTLVAGNVVFGCERAGFDQDKVLGYPANLFYGNLAFGCTRYGLFMDAPSLPQDEDAVLYNNLAYGNETLDLRVSNNLAVQKCDYNFWADAGFVENMDEHSLSGDPLLNDPDLVINIVFESGWSIDQKLGYIRDQVRHKFRLRPGSQATDSGMVIPGYHNASAGDEAGDGQVWYGSAPDIGAFEVVLAAIADVSVHSTSRNSVTIAWTPPDQEVYRRPTYYDIRYATELLDESSWAAATRAQGQPLPGDSGGQQSFTLTGLSPAITYYVAIETRDELGNRSWLSNVVSGTTTTSGNRAPVFEPIGDKSVFETQTLTFTVGATDADGDTLTYSASGLPTGASFTPATRVFTWTPTNTQSGTHWVTFGVTDGQIPVTQTIAITVAEVVNNAPVLAAIGNKNVNEGSLLSFSVSGTDSDGHSLTYSATGLPSGANFTGQTFTWVPTYEQAGTYSVTFRVSDGELTDSEPITITVANVTPDLTAPTTAASYPAVDAIQVPLNPVISLTVSDAGQGVDAGTVTIRVNDQLVYSGNAASYQSVYGVCSRTGTQASYRYAYQPAEAFRFDEQVSVRVTASDLAGNAMTPHNCSFTTEMRVFGDNRPASWAPDDADKTSPATVCDSAGNIWLAYHAGEAGQRDIYVSKLTLGSANFAGPIQLTTHSSDQCFPAIAIGTDDTLYVVWQDRRRGNWDIYIRTSGDGLTWAAETRITDSDDNQIRPAIAVDSQSPNRACVTWQDDGAGNQDIYVGVSNNAFSTKTITQVTTNASDQTDPAIAVDASNTVYLVWADGRNGTNDVYGAASNSGPWTNVAVATGAGSQSAPVVATEAAGTVLHFAWVDDAGTDATIRYASSDGMPGSPLAGTNVVDDTSGADQMAPSIATVGSAGESLQVFLCWTDERNVNANGRDTDLYFVDVSAGQGTNVLVGDGGTGSDQSEPAVGVDRYGYPYVLWTDSRNVAKYVYYAGSTYMAPDLLESELVTASTGRTIGVVPPTSLNDVSVVIPAGACPHDVTITIARLLNPQSILSSNVLAFDFGPSGLQFNQPVTVTIPYPAADYSGGTPVPCWYVSETGTLSQQDITDVQILDLSDTLKALRFRTTHFTSYYLLESFVDDDGDGTWDGDDGGDSSGGGGGGGGGCALSHASRESVIAFLLPYVALALYMSVLRWRDHKRIRLYK